MVNICVTIGLAFMAPIVNFNLTLIHVFFMVIHMSAMFTITYTLNLKIYIFVSYNVAFIENSFCFKNLLQWERRVHMVALQIGFS